MKQLLNVRTLLFAVGALVLTGAVIASLDLGHVATKKSSTSQAAVSIKKVEKTNETVQPTTVAISEPVKVSGKTAEVATVSGKVAKAVPATKPSGGNPRKAKEEILDPTARAALSFVGADWEAEQYWTAAINDPNLPANERKDLIEDLNEDGLSDPKHPGPQDMPLILSRISLIEQLAPAAIDQVNAEAFQEAYKDLLNLAAGGTAQ